MKRQTLKIAEDWFISTRKHLTFPDNRNSSNRCTYATIKNNKVLNINQYSICFALLRYSFVKCDAVISVTYPPTSECTQEDFEEYFKWLINTSPFADAFETKSVEFVTKVGVICRTNIPANYLMNALICTRYPFEHPHVVHLWNKLCQQNKAINKDLAFAICHSAAIYDGSHFTVELDFLLHHYAVHHKIFKLDNLKRFIKHKPHALSQSFYDLPTTSKYSNFELYCDKLSKEKNVLKILYAKHNKTSTSSYIQFGEYSSSRDNIFTLQNLIDLYEKICLEIQEKYL